MVPFLNVRGHLLPHTQYLATIHWPAGVGLPDLVVGAPIPREYNRDLYHRSRGKPIDAIYRTREAGHHLNSTYLFDIASD